MTTYTATPESRANAAKTLADHRAAIRKAAEAGSDPKTLALMGDVYFALQRQMADAGDLD